MHLFLTGDIKVGKSTIIHKLIAKHNLSADGFRTFWEQKTNEIRHLYLAPYSFTHKSDHVRHLLVREHSGSFHKSDNISEIFDSVGAETLNKSGNCDLTVMDELGFLEADAMSFQFAVLKRLSIDNPVIGVIKPMHNPFLDAIRKHPNVSLHVVTRKNRDDVFLTLLSLVGVS